MTQEEIKKRIEMYGLIINDPSEDQGTKDLAQSKVVKLQSQLEDEVVVEEVVEEEVEETVEEKPAKKPAPKKKTTKAKGRGRPKKRGRPAKRKKAPTSKQKATKLSKAIGLSEEECRELLEKYDSEDKARKKRLSKRKKAGKSADLTVTESLEKETKVVKHKVADKKTPTSKTQAKAQGSRITALVKAILEGIEGKTDKVKQIDAIISQLEAEKKRIQSQKGVGGFLFGSAVGGYTGYKVGTLQEKRKVEDLFKSEKKLAKDFKDAMKEQKKKKKEEEKFEYAEFEDYAKGGNIDAVEVNDYIEELNDSAISYNKSATEWNIGGKNRSDEYFERYGEALKKYAPKEFRKGLKKWHKENSYAKGGLLKGITDGEPATERQILLLKRRLNNKEYKALDKETTETLDYIQESADSGDDYVRITPEQTKKGLDFLKNLWKTPAGKERKNNPFGLREQDALENFEYFTLDGFYDDYNGYRHYYIPIYGVTGTDSYFQYYYDGEVNIIGAKGKQLAKGGTLQPKDEGVFALFRNSRETEDNSLPMISVMVGGKWKNVATDDVQAIYNVDGKGDDFEYYVNLEGVDVIEKGEDYEFTFANDEAQNKAYPKRITMFRIYRDDYAKGGKLPTAEEIYDGGEFLDEFPVDESMTCSNCGEGEVLRYKGKVYQIITWNERAEDHEPDSIEVEEMEDYDLDNVFQYWKNIEINDPTFWLDRGEYNTSAMVESASYSFDVDENVLETYADEYVEKSYAKGGDTDKGLTGTQRDRMTDDIYMSEQTMSDSMFQAIDDEVDGDWDVGLYRLSDSQLKKMHTDIKEDRASSYRE